MLALGSADEGPAPVPGAGVLPLLAPRAQPAVVHMKSVANIIFFITWIEKLFRSIGAYIRMSVDKNMLFISRNVRDH